jgi:hypothetical protein
MQFKTLIYYAFFITFFICSSCKKDKSPTPIEPTPNGDQLPPITQSGANTFGCLVNGKVWIPKGASCGTKPNPNLVYDIGFNGKPYLDVKTNHFVSCISKGFMNISFGSLDHLGTYYYPTDFDFSSGWPDITGNCATIAFDTTIKKWGNGIITRLDVPNRIISGTFDCKYKTLLCDTVFITDGRFDIKF